MMTSIMKAFKPVAAASRPQASLTMWCQYPIYLCDSLAEVYFMSPAKIDYKAPDYN